MDARGRQEGDSEIAERNKQLLREDPYGDAAGEAATEAAHRLIEAFGSYKGIMGIRGEVYHGGIDIGVFFLTKAYMNDLTSLIPHDFEGFFVRRHAPFWAIGELCAEYRQKVLRSDVVVYGTQEQRDRDAFYDLVMREEELKWAGMTFVERREFIDDLLASRRKAGWDVGNCYGRWREQEF